jgi:hypothetical protein
MKIKNFAILSGENTTIKDGVIKYLPAFAKTDAISNIDKPITADLRADKNFYQGILKFKFKAKKDDTGILIHHKDEDNGFSSIGLSRSSKSFIIFDRQSSTDLSAGSLKNYPINKEIQIEIQWFGSKVKLFVDSVLLCEANKFVPKFLPISLRVTSSGEVNIYDFELETVRPKLFVVMQFTEEYNNLYDEVIFPISEKLGFECIRADEYYTSTPILSDIITSIEESTAIIAEITPDNPNVFYEIGYAHAIKKPTILLCDKKREKLPFDVSGFRTLFYENTIAGKSKVEKSLTKYLENIIA